MRITELILDHTRPGLVHASLTCEHNAGLTDHAEARRGESIADLDELFAAVDDLGYIVPAWATRGMRHCHHCTLVVTTEWAVAA